VKVALFTREYPPEVYGGAGVHVEYLSRELARRIEVEVGCFGEPRPPPALPGLTVLAAEPWPALAPADRRGPLGVLTVDLQLAAGVTGADVAHSHTWYANLAGHLAALTAGVPHVMTSHSLEPLRPWKAEQLGPGGYAISSWCERTAIEAADAVIAVSGAMRDDVVRTYPAVDPARIEVVHNGIDAEEYRPVDDDGALRAAGVDPERPVVLFVGRITRQKGIVHLVRAARDVDRSAQVVLLAGAPDTEAIGREMTAAVGEARSVRGDVVWIDRMLPRADVIQFLSHATVFVCPSVYEPLGIVNLEAMACEAAVVASAVGGIPEVVDDGVTGLLVPFEARPDGTGEPADPTRFAADLAARVNELVGDPARAADMGRAGRKRVLEEFTWGAVADRTLELYRRLAG
jgi:alpha-maltose-1-phosphate synthase